MNDKRKLDIDQVEAALKRAARTAVKGPRDARAGRAVVVPPKLIGPRKEDAPAQLQQAADLLMSAPSEATARQLRDLHIRVAIRDKKA